MRMITMLTPFPSGCLTYPLKRAGHVFPALCPGHVTLEHLPLGQSLFLHCLRSRTGGFVRQLRKYYGTVRLPVSVHHRCASLDFPMRSGIPSLPDKQTRDLPVSAQDAYVHAQGLRPRGVQKRLAIPTPPVLPSAQFNNVGTPEWPSLARWWFNFAAPYLACTLPCQRFTLALTHEGT